MIKIYTDTDVCTHHANNIKNDNFELVNEILYADYAIFHMPCPFNSDPIFRDKINQALKICKKLVILVSELHYDSVKFFKENQDSKIVYFISGIVNNIKSNHWLDWIHRTSDFYKRNIRILDQLSPYEGKSKSFDILLGRNRPHRNVVHNFINENLFNDKVIMTYLDGLNTIEDQDNQGWVWGNRGVELPNTKITGTVTVVEYYGQKISLSQIIPIDIYNQTAYTVVAETNHNNQYSFYTEKIVKPILAERLFIVFSGQHYLRNLRNLGFKTFDGIVNETYDDIEDYNLRFELACEQITYLINQPQEKILEQIRPITEHNRRIMLETDWYGDFSKELRAVLLDHTKQN
jgi:hypothetical protein